MRPFYDNHSRIRRAPFYSIDVIVIMIWIDHRYYERRKHTMRICDHTETSVLCCHVDIVQYEIPWSSVGHGAL
jgi:hypothetical protein